MTSKSPLLRGYPFQASDRPYLRRRRRRRFPLRRRRRDAGSDRNTRQSSPKLCTLEFEIRRASYYWLLQALGIYQPYVWEYSRLNISNTVMSKRKLNRLVTKGWVDGWDDPRLMTLDGLRRRGVSSTSINAFVRGLGITRRLKMLISNNKPLMNLTFDWHT